MAKVRIKRDQSSVSPNGRIVDLSPRRNETDTATNYVKKLATVAKDRKTTVLSKQKTRILEQDAEYQAEKEQKSTN